MKTAKAEGPIMAEAQTGLAEKTPMTDRGGKPFHEQMHALHAKLLRPRASACPGRLLYAE